MNNILLLRHFPTNENKKGLIIGQLDVELQKEFKNIDVSILKGIDTIYIFSSELIRAKKTTDILIKSLQSIKSNINIIIRYSSKLNERNMGEWEGKIKKDIIKLNNKKFINGYLIPTETPPCGENFNSFFNRVKWLISELNKLENKTIIISSHNQFLKLFVHTILKNNKLEHWSNLKFKHGEIISLSYLCNIFYENKYGINDAKKL